MSVSARRPHTVRIGVVITVLLTVAALIAPNRASASGYVEARTDNPVTAAPPVTRPATPSCRVSLATRFPSNTATGTPQRYSGTLTPPTACPGPWAKVVLDQTITVSGRQYDRVGDLLIGTTEVYWGTTEEPSGPTATTYHVATDITRFSSLLRRPQKFSGGIGNNTSSVYTGVYVQTVAVTYYRASRTAPAPPTPDVVIGSPALTATASNSIVHVSLHGLPRNIVRATLEITLEGSGCDEQWFDDVQYQVSAQFPKADLCGNGPYREADVALDNQAVGAVQTFPYIYSGGIVPTLWRPIPAIGTFDLTPETIDMTPFAGQLVDGRTHDLLIDLDNAGDSWSIIPTLLLYTDHGASTTSGKLVTDDVAPIASELQVTDRQSATSITTTDTSSRDDTTSGYINTSIGRITTTVVRKSAYNNTMTVSGNGLVQHVDQAAHGTQTVTASLGGLSMTDLHSWNYPLTVDSSAAGYVDDQNFVLTGHVAMTRQLGDRVTACGHTIWSRNSTESVDSYGELARSKGVTTTSDGHSTSTFTGQDDSGRPYQATLASQHGLVTQDVVTPPS